MDYLGLVEDMLMERHGTWWNESMGHMTRNWRHVTKRKGDRESMEFHGRSWKSQGEKNVYIYYLVANQASKFLASDFVFLCVLFV